MPVNFRFGERSGRWAGTAALLALVVVLATACASPVGFGPTPHASATAAPGSGPTLSTKDATNVALQTWVTHLASMVGLDTGTLPKSEIGFQLQTDTLTIPVDKAEGQQQNQAMPSGKVEWVALPSAKPQLLMLARIKTTWNPQSPSSVPQSTQDDLVMLARQRVGAPWHILGYPSLSGETDAQITTVRHLNGGLPASASLPVKPSSLPSTYWTYVNGGASSAFAPGPLTDQLRASMAQGEANVATVGASVSYPFEAGAVIGSYAVGGGDGLVFFGVRYATVSNGPPGSCLIQAPSERGLPTIVPDGKYDQVRVEYRSIDVALEDPSTGMVSILGASTPIVVGQSNTPTQSPACR